MSQLTKPKKTFKTISAVPNLPSLEKEIIAYWKQLDPISVLKKRGKAKPQKVYYDGPITANNLPHYGHTVQWTLKDVIPRYWTMKGYYVSRNIGWDCQGIPVEYEVEKELGFQKKADIVAYGVEKFNNLCRASVEKYKNQMITYETRLGRWLDLTDSYSTMDATFIESCWWSLKELYAKGLLYEGYKVVAYSTRAGTSLSTHEVEDGGYKDFEDPWVTVKFRSTKDPNCYFLAWTTTPWTLPGNLLLGVGERLDYAVVCLAGSDDRYILAKAKVAEVFADQSYTIQKTLLGKDLIAETYTPLFPYFAAKQSEGCFKIVAAAHATADTGTGLVHLAPYGAEDFAIFQKLGISIVDYLDDTANFTSLIPELAGTYYLEANSKLLTMLTATQAVFASGTLNHSLPVCWRTGTPLIYKPVKSWYIAVTKLKAKLVHQNKTVNWVPARIGKSSAEVWLNNARDWALSRNRYWGTPLPVWINDMTSERVVVGSFAELEQLSGIKLNDPHRPYVDAITWQAKTNNGTFRRVPDVLDVWYDSGAMPFAQYHYPFEQSNLFKSRFPADYVSEASEQARLWFYTLNVLGVALFDTIPYKNVIAHGIMVDKNQQRLSKKKHNYPPMDDVLDTFGGDVLRYFVLTSPIVQAEPAKFTTEVLAEAQKEFFIPLWNCVRFFCDVATKNDIKPTATTAVHMPTDPLDQWLLARLNQTTTTITQLLDTYTIMPAARELNVFLTDLSTWYIRRSRAKLNQGDVPSLATLYYALKQLVLLCAPFLPFISEALFEQLGMRTKNLSSVHFAKFPTPQKPTAKAKTVLTNMQTTRNLVSMALGLREQLQLKIRQPLQTLYITGSTQTTCYSQLIADEVNVKTLVFSKPTNHQLPSLTADNLTVWLDPKLSDGLILEGVAREFVRQIQQLRKKQNLASSDKISVTYKPTTLLTQAISKHLVDIKTKVGAVSVEAGNDFELRVL